MSPCEAHVLRLGIFLDEDQETQKIPLNYALNYAPERHLTENSVVRTSIFQFI